MGVGDQAHRSPLVTRQVPSDKAEEVEHDRGFEAAPQDSCGEEGMGQGHPSADPSGPQMTGCSQVTYLFQGLPEPV